MTTTDIVEFSIEVPDEAITDLRARLRNTRYTAAVGHVEEQSLVPVADMRRLIGEWEKLDWRAVEARLNKALPQYTTVIDSQTVHFVHALSVKPNAPALLLLHGWPSTFAEFEPIVEPLTEKFNVVVPSLPSFAFSPPPSSGGWGRQKVANAFVALMEKLGYSRFLVHGGDLGAYITAELGRAHPKNVAGIHVDQVYSVPAGGDAGDDAGSSSDERQDEQRMSEFVSTRMAYIDLQTTQPQNVAHAFADSPVGQLAWAYQLFGTQVSDDFILTTASLYWFTETMSSAMRFYWEDGHIGLKNPPIVPPTTVPVAVAEFPYDFTGIRHLAERDHANIVRWTNFPEGGHYPAEQAADAMVADIVDFGCSVLPD